ncbi:hypothetical protein D082_01500 [Synechocystis sp. PCC 6714]|nr:hypothetical protein D082_01500 [Synechocystis sp. PCC 6714]
MRKTFHHNYNYRLCFKACLQSFSLPPKSPNSGGILSIFPRNLGGKGAFKTRALI